MIETAWSGHGCDAGDLDPYPEGLSAVGSMVGGWNVVAAEVEEVADPVVGAEEALCLAG